MMRAAWKNNLYVVWHWLIMLIAFSFPFGRSFTTRLIIIFTVFSFFLHIYNRAEMRPVFRQPGKSDFIWLLFLPLSYLLLCLIGLIYTDDIDRGANELFKPISFLFIPATFFIFSNQLTNEKIDQIMVTFFWGMFTCALISIGLGFYRSFRFVDGEWIFRTAVNDISYQRGDSFLQQQTQGGNYFFSGYISPFIHTTYYAMYLSFAALFGLLRVFKNVKWRFIYLCASVMLVGLVFLCDSKGALISFLASLFLLCLIALPGKYRIAGVILVIIGSASFIYLSPRTSLMIRNFRETQANITYHTTESTALRILVWKVSLDIARENWLLGVGTGDAEKALLEKTQPVNKMAFEKKLNSHNQYLQCLITWGVPGIITVLLMVFSPLFFGIKSREYLIVCFSAILGFNMIFESVFQVFQGIQFFIFFYCVLMLKLYNRHESAPAV
jgi:O-antigen ligase